MSGSLVLSLLLLIWQTAKQTIRWDYYALLSVSYLQFHGITFTLVFVLFVSLHRKFGTPYLLKFVNVKPWLPSDVT